MPASRTDSRNLENALEAAIRAARDAGEVLRRNLHRSKRVSESTRHDIKLELDERCQRLIARTLRPALPDAAILGEEASSGDPGAALRWVVDPIDGTVNFSSGVPHACISIALQERDPNAANPPPDSPTDHDGFRTRLGVVYDPFTDELWEATDRSHALLNRRRIRATARPRLDHAIVALGFAKDARSLDRMLPVFQHLVHRVRKIRIMGAAALSLVYVASGRFDAYVEHGVRLWDIAAGGFIIQRAGGVFWRRPVDRDRGFEIVTSGAPLQRALHRVQSVSRPT